MQVIIIVSKKKPAYIIIATNNVINDNYIDFSPKNKNRTCAEYRKCDFFFIQCLFRDRFHRRDFGNEEHIGWYKPVYLGFIHQTVPHF